MDDQDLRAVLRELLEEGRQLSITRGGEDGIVARYAARIEPTFDDLRGEITKLKGQLRAARKAAAEEAAEAAKRAP